MYMQLEDKPNCMGPFYWSPSSSQHFSFWSSSWKMVWAIRYTVRTVVGMPPCSWDQSSLRILDACLASAVIPNPLLWCICLWTGVGENGKTKTKGNLDFPHSLRPTVAPFPVLQTMIEDFSWSSILPHLVHSSGFQLVFWVQARR